VDQHAFSPPSLAGSQLTPEQGLWRTADGSAHARSHRAGGSCAERSADLRDPAVRDVHNPRPVPAPLAGGDHGDPRASRATGRLEAVVGCTFLGPAEAIRPGLRLEGRDLVVEGCRFGICRGERWTRIH
jgi:hypothetical protein